jgi:hypothetical protein
VKFFTANYRPRDKWRKLEAYAARKVTAISAPTLTGNRHIFISRSAIAPGSFGRNKQKPDASEFRLIIRKQDGLLNIALSC